MLLAILAGSDYLFQRWQYYKNMRMTHQEYKEEVKQTEGDPVLKARMRSIQMEIARKRMMTDVPKSDVVITNPNHYAVALRYEPEKSHAPVVVAKGQNYLAQKIREIAEAEGVPLVENPPLARAIYKQVDVGQAIPAPLFKAVALVLASVWKLAQKRGRDWSQARPRAA
jgi:flagellar biosynthetic protein FlhB